MNNRLVPSPAAEKLNGAIGDDLVHVHVRGSPATSLEDVDNKLVIESPLHNLLGRGNNSLALLRIQQSQLHVGSRSGELDQSYSPDEFLRKTQTRYGKVLDRSLGLSAIIRRTRDFDFAHGVPIQPILLNCHHYSDAEKAGEMRLKTLPINSENSTIPF